MGFMMIWVLVGVLGVLVGIAVGSTLLGGRRTDATFPPQTERLLAEQTERIAQLEDELARVREQADFTERLLSERGTANRDIAPPAQPDPGRSADAPPASDEQR